MKEEMFIGAIKIKQVLLTAQILLHEPPTTNLIQFNFIYDYSVEIVI